MQNKVVHYLPGSYAHLNSTKGFKTDVSIWITGCHVLYLLQVVPPNQAQMMYDAVKAKGLPTVFVLFKGMDVPWKAIESVLAQNLMFPTNTPYLDFVLNQEPASIQRCCPTVKKILL